MNLHDMDCYLLNYTSLMSCKLGKSSGYALKTILGFQENLGISIAQEKIKMRLALQSSRKYQRTIQWVVIASMFLLTIMLPVQSAFGDNIYASIRGTVTDPSGAAVANANVTATNVGTGISAKVTTSSTGAFAFPQLPIGDYKVTITAPSFKTFEAAGVHLDLNQVYALNAKLEVGTVSEAIEVQANPVQVESTDMQLGATVSGQQIVDIPLNGRNWTQLQQLQPGVVGTTDRFGGNNGAFSGNGQETQQNSFLINGVDSNDPTLNTALVIPSPDAIGEFRLVTNTLNPEYGRNSGTVINAVIKNGTNSFHGSGFEFYRDTFLDARSWFRKRPSPFHQNEFGGTIGGPIVKDHAFFFFSYQGLRNRQPQNGANTSVPVFTAAERGGDFSADAGAFSSNPNPVAMFGDSASTCPVGGAPCAAGSSTYASLFSTGVIPAADLNPLSVKLMNQFVPLPNSGSDFLFNPTTTSTYNQYLYRIDDKLGSKDALWFYGLYQTNPSTDTLPFTGSTLPGFAEQAKRHQQQYSVDWTHTFTPSVLNEARFGYTRFNFAAVEPVSTIDPTAYGFTGIVPQDRAVESLPLMTVAGLFTLGFSNNGPQPRIQDTYQFVDNFSKVWGRHNFKAGVDVDINQVNNPFFNNHNGNFSFNGAGPFSTTIQGADFLLGLPDTYTQGSGSTVRERGKEYYAYVQDQWQVRPNLTLTLGTGWDVETPWRNLFGNGEIMAAFRQGQQSRIFPNAPVGYVYPGDPGINKYGGMSVHYDDFAPRLGFAWSPGSSHKWSVRGGVGLYYNRSESELSLQSLTNAPFAITSIGGTVDGSPVFATPFVGYSASTPGTTNAHAQLFPFTPPSAGSNISFTPFEPIGLGTVVNDPKTTAPRATNYNLTIERQLDRATIVSVGYVGSEGRHLEGAYVLNLAGQAPGVNPAAAAFNGGSCFTGFVLNTALCPAPGTPGGPPLDLNVYGHTGFETTEYNSRYNSLQVEVNRRFSNGLQILAAYTWSRYFDQTSSLENSAFNFPGINTFDPKHMWAPSANDAPQRFVVSYTYTLPFYKLAHHWKRLLDDWNVVGIYTLQHGTPVGVFNLFSTSLTCDLNVSFFACPDRVDATGTKLHFTNPRSFNPTLGGNFWFDNGSAAFSVPTGSIGTASRNPFYGPGINYSDLALEKSIHIDESKYIQLRLETFNTFNHANFNNPLTPGFNSEDASVLDSATFGQIFRVQTLSTNGDGRVLQLGAKFYF
jgi:Carboxypeptidase regulatory-like domain